MTEPFYFADGQLAYSAEDLLELCRKFPDDGSNYLVREDLEKWLTYIGKEDIAQCAASARQTALDDRQKLDEFLAKCHALSSVEAESAPEVLQSTTVEETKPEPTATETTPAKPEPTVQAVATKTTPAKPEPTVQSSASDSTKKSPTFFRAIARLVVNVLYRNKN
ncbi:MAG: hypothetical protein QNJ72_29250 [Pleurocapsa sp. MO_226.B13]|nr:hypothetical protein [Pleurocapsa sp. MO_226.B13]